MIGFWPLRMVKVSKSISEKCLYLLSFIVIVRSIAHHRVPGRTDLRDGTDNTNTPLSISTQFTNKLSIKMFYNQATSINAQGEPTSINICIIIMYCIICSRPSLVHPYSIHSHAERKIDFSRSFG